MKIAYLCHDPLPSPSNRRGWSRTPQIVRGCAALSALGCDIDLLFPASAPEGTDIRAAFEAAYGFPAGHLPSRLRLRPVTTVGPVPEGCLDGLFDIRGSVLSSRSPYDLVYTRDPFALAVSLCLGNRTVFETFRVDLQDRPVFAPWRRYCFGHRRLAGVVAHSRFAGQAFLAAGLDPARLLVAYNGHEPEHAAAPRTATQARRELGLPLDGELVAYAGSVGAHKGLDSVLALALALPHVRFLLVGAVPGSSDRRKVLGQAARNVQVLDHVPPDAVFRYLYAADCLLVPPASAPLMVSRRTVLPMKIFQYLAAGRPILAPNLPDVREVLEDDRNAVLVPPNDVQAAAAALRRILSDLGFRNRLSRAALADAAKYTWSARAVRIRTFLERIKGAGTTA